MDNVRQAIVADHETPMTVTLIRPYFTVAFDLGGLLCLSALLLLFHVSHHLSEFGPLAVRQGSAIPPPTEQHRIRDACV